MYEKSNLFAIMQEKTPDRDPKVLRIALDESTRKSVVELFSKATKDLRYCPNESEKTALAFHADYTAQPELDEYIEIDNFSIPKTIQEAIDRSLQVKTYEPDKDNLPLIRALFVGEKQGDEYLVSLQRFRTAQYLRASSVHLTFSSNTLTSASSNLWSKISKKVGLSVMPSVDAACLNGRLCFTSLYYAKQIFDLTDYYIEASKTELEEFVALDGLHVEDPSLIVNEMTSWERRKIASIKNAKIIEEHPLNELLGSAQELKYDLPTTNGKLVIPSDKKERKKLFQFLDEDVYRGMLTGSIYETNSKKYI